MKTRLHLLLGTLALSLTAGSALSGPETAVQGQKIDSGLGELSHYSSWSDRSGRIPLGQRVLGESLDDGLGELPHYSKWLDRSGRDPLGRQATQIAEAKR